ncbi:branched-chain amino acid ABC transporter permease [Paracoccus sp. P2]|uniref:Branched-chain amino acid ABC transporter permease n=1 Tax=Paracoccus pantotrophus TaxID=82367 RepID=A0A7H9C051_PARPN|nr:branched-chain amino acid ABC transporter permease [Paracoccus pantotrophus]MDF3854214.1 branched-chain amino acid ABC transporter permease [Paracoccus pantotrophus]QLH16843.1 branched-chain amino acid ABC transporter permease [Paracoccus pantotrophus]RNI14955.1 branched-chain amino acid ABC transporter permease [Paracoccus pantotrophus]SFO27266.1 branched-chain amino acid transport system permease protein [Paracoccus pantotrophus]
MKNAFPAYRPLALAVLAAAVLAMVPLIGPRAMVQDLFGILCLLVLALNWNMLAGFAGLVSVGQQAFVGIGAYTMFAAVILFGLDPLAGVLLGGLVAMALAVPVACFVFRLNGAYFAIGTWVAAEIARLGLGQWKALGGGTGTSLPKGTTRDMLGVGSVKEWLGVSSAAASDILLYWLALGLVLATLAASWAFLRSRLGLGLQAIRDNAMAARAVGVDPVRLKALVFLLTAFGTGLCGGLLFIQITRITPDAAFSLLDWTAFVLFVVVIGGIGTLPGPIVGVVLFYALERLLSDYGSAYLIVLGLFGIAVMLFARRGLWGSLSGRTGLELLPLGHRAPDPASAVRP